MRRIRTGAITCALLAGLAGPPGLRAQAPANSAGLQGGSALGVSLGRYAYSPYGLEDGITSVSFRATTVRWGLFAPELDVAWAPVLLTERLLALGINFGFAFPVRLSGSALLFRAGLGPVGAVDFGGGVAGAMGAYGGFAFLVPTEGGSAVRLDAVPHVYVAGTSGAFAVFEVSLGITSFPESS